MSALGVRGVDLEADRVVAARHDRERQADGEDAALEEAADHRARAIRVAHHQRHHRVRPGDRLEPERLEAGAGTGRVRAFRWARRSRPSALSATSTAATAAAQSAAPSGLV